MNRYQQEVAEMDRRHRLLVHTLSLAGTAALLAVALWSAGISPAQWWVAAHLWSPANDSDAQVVTNAPVSVPVPTGSAPAVPASSTHEGAGTDSSISPLPQPLYLIATTPGRNEHEGTARIGTSRDNPQTYVAGAILVNGARVSEIHSDHVVLERGKGKTSLFLASARDGVRAEPTRGSVELAMVPAMSSRPAALELLGVDALGEVIRAMGYYENDVLQGLQVVPGRQAGTFVRLGLKSADVIVAIDSVPVTDAQSALEQLQTLTQGAAVSVSVRRGAAVHRLSLDGTLIESAIPKTSTLAQPAPSDLGRTFQ